MKPIIELENDNKITSKLTSQKLSVSVRTMRWIIDEEPNVFGSIELLSSCKKSITESDCLHPNPV